MDELENDMQFLHKIIAEICDYAVDNGMSPDKTLCTVAENILVLCKIASYSNWKKEGEQK